MHFPPEVVYRGGHNRQKAQKGINRYPINRYQGVAKNRKEARVKMKRKFNFARITAFLLALTLLFILYIQDAGSLVWAEKRDKNEPEEASEETILSETGAKGASSKEGELLWQVGESAYGSFSDACLAAAEADTGSGEDAVIRLMADTTLKETLTIDTTITIDLNGHVLDRGATASDGAADNNVITIGTGGDLTIEDSDPKSVHSGAVYSDGLWRWNEDGTGDTTITGGIITGGSAVTTGGGIVVNGGGKLTMNGGTLAGNCSTEYSGGGLRVDLGNAELTDVNVCYNTAVNGGGVYSTAMLSVEGGSILNNKATSDGGGVGVWGGTTTLRNVSLSGNIAGNASRTAIYVMNDNSRLNIKGASTQIDGTVTASTNVSERIHLSNKLRWNGNTIEAAEQTIDAGSGNTLAAAGIASTVGDLGKIIVAGGNAIAESSDTKVQEPVTFFARWNIWYLKQAVMLLQKLILPMETLLSRIRAQLHRQLARLPSQLSQFCSMLSKLPSILPRQPSELIQTALQLPRPPSQLQHIPNLLPRLPSQIAAQSPIAQTAGFGYNISTNST
jgi:hypothetical protein